VKRKNVNITLAILTAVALFIIFCPLPYRVMCPIEIKPRDADPVYVDVPGTLLSINVEPWQEVNPGDELGQLQNSDLAIEIADLESRLAVQTTTADVLRREAIRHDEAARELPEVLKTVESLDAQLKKKREDVGRLRLVARTKGTVLPPPEEHAKPRVSKELPTFSGSVLDRKNLGAYLTGNLFCQIGDPHKWEANIVIDQDDYEFVHKNQAVDIKLDEMPFETFHTTIEDIGPKLEYSSRQLSSKGGGGLMTKLDESGVERPINTSYQAHAPIDDPNGDLVQGLRGTAKIHASWQPLGKRFWRFLIRTFNFNL
jgi:hypothetical protein